MSDLGCGNCNRRLPQVVRQRPPLQPAPDSAEAAALPGEATGYLLLHGARHRRDVVLDKEGVEHDERQRPAQGPRHQRAPAVDIAVD